MTIKRYLLIVYAMWLAMFVTIIAATWEPESMAPGFYQRLAFVLPLGAALMTHQLYRYAKRTEPKDRLSFWSYREANSIIYFTLAATAACAVYVLVTGG